MIYNVISKPFLPPQVCILTIFHVTMVAPWRGASLDKAKVLFMARLVFFLTFQSIMIIKHMILGLSR